MATIRDMLTWFMSGEGRLMAAAVLFAVMWAVKSIPWVEEKILTTARRKAIAVAVLAAAPVPLMMLTTDVPIREVLITAAEALFGAMGLHIGLKTARGPSSS